MVVLMILVSTLLSGRPTLQTLYMEGEQFHRCNHHKKITKTLYHKRFSLGPSYRISRVYKWYWTMWVAMRLCGYEAMCLCGYVCRSSLRRWSLFLLVGITDPDNHTYSESWWWKLYKNHQRTQVQRQTQWQNQRQRQRQFLTNIMSES